MQKIIKEPLLRITKLKKPIKWTPAGTSLFMKIITAVLANLKSMKIPGFLRTVISLLHTLSQEKFKDEDQKRATRNSVTTLIFLSYIAASIVSAGSVVDSTPKKQRKATHTSAITRNTISLAKCLQMIFNQSLFDESSPYAIMNPFLEQNFHIVQDFIDAAIQPSLQKPSPLDSFVSPQSSMNILLKYHSQKLRTLYDFVLSLYKKEDITAFVDSWVINEVEHSRFHYAACDTTLFIASTTRNAKLFSLDEMPPNANKGVAEAEADEEEGDETAFSRSGKKHKRRGSFLKLKKRNPHDITAESPEDYVSEAAQKHNHVILVFYRGSWCRFCKLYMRDWDSEEIMATVKEYNIMVIGVTSEKKKFVTNTRAQWNLHTITLLSDPDSTLADKYGIDVERQLKSNQRWAPFASHYKKLKAMAQPGVVVLSPMMEIEYYWKSVPSAKNLFGARDRPTASSIILELCRQTTNVLTSSLTQSDGKLGVRETKLQKEENEERRTHKSRKTSTDFQEIGMHKLFLQNAQLNARINNLESKMDQILALLQDQNKQVENTKSEKPI
eukprot:TRINITY_DN9754_c0_g1_i2.p1 TRINITY_DN9754_c0_g1~~TRINITY_DN9754_c0_g1_i2.p1  ORF type:complete len:556 (-),score=78.77 TRINITY_DN9754_c0_g1_i2:650-2317(-)